MEEPRGAASLGLAEGTWTPKVKAAKISSLVTLGSLTLSSLGCGDRVTGDLLGHCSAHRCRLGGHTMLTPKWASREGSEHLEQASKSIWTKAGISLPLSTSNYPSPN